METNPFRTAGLVLLIVGVLDVGLMIYTVMNDESYTSSLNIFAIVVGALLMRGNVRTARVVRWGSVFFGIFFLAALFALLLITPEALFMTQMKLDMMGTITPFIVFILAVVIQAFLFYQLSTPESLQKLEDKAFRSGMPYSAFGLSLIAGGALIYFLSSMLSGENADHAKQLARNELGNNFAYHVTSLNISESGTVAVVVAYNVNEIRNIEVSWAAETEPDKLEICLAQGTHPHYPVDGKCSAEYERGDYETVFAQWKSLAEEGNAYAQHNLGQLYREGRGTTKNHETAFELYRRAAQQGLLISEHNVAFMTEKGFGTTQNLEEAVNIYRSLAEQGVAISQFAVGLAHANGEGAPKDYEEAARWYRLAANQGYYRAQINLASLYRRGKGVPQDYEKAINLYTPNAERGIPLAQFWLGRMHHNGLGVAKNIETAVKWYKDAAELGYYQAQYRLSKAYVDGDGIKKDYHEAFRWAQLGARNGYSKSTNLRNWISNHLGILYQKGDGVPKDEIVAIKWFRHAAVRKYGPAQYRLARAYIEGRGVPKNLVNAKKWNNLAKKNGYKQADELERWLVGQMSEENIKEAALAANKCASEQFKKCD